MGEALHALLPVGEDAQPSLHLTAESTTNVGGYDIGSFLRRYESASSQQLTEAGKQSVVLRYGETALAMLEAIAHHGAIALSPWKPIRTMPLTTELVWLRRGEIIDGPRRPDTYDFDQYTHWAHCTPPSGALS
jgi:hypothetical protein